MHWKLSSEFAGLPEIDLRAHDALLDRLLHVHLQRNHLLCLSPAEVVALRRAIQFGPQASRVLETILRRSQDYAASVRAASRHIVLLPMGSAPRSPLGVEFYVRSEDASWWLEQTPSLYVENAISDGLFYSYLISSVAKHLGSSSTYLMIRPYHGGGNPLGAVIEAIVGEKIQGVCVCDRDATCEVPPFTSDSTSEKAYAALHKLRVIEESGVSAARNPFFKFRVTRGWGVENYVGPHTLGLFFEANPETSAMRMPFLSAFPNFPVLSEQEYVEWFSINFKSAGQDGGPISDGLCQRLGMGIIPQERCSLLAKLAMPDSVIPFIVSTAKSGRYRMDMKRAFDRDLASSEYGSAVRDLARSAIDALAADTQMNFA